MSSTWGPGDGVKAQEPRTELTIDDFTSRAENVDNTFTFVVRLSRPAPAGGVTFDISTENDTALAPDDFTAKSLTAQSIPAGQSTYKFDVIVHAIVEHEEEITFWVNVTNVSAGVLVSDDRAVGTIIYSD